MADPLSIIGVAYPIARDLVALVQELERVYKGIRYAKQDLKKVIIRTNIVAGTYGFFSETMNNVEQIKELASIFGRHGKLIETVKSESRKIIGKLERITNIFPHQITGKSANTVDKWIAQYQWYKESKKAVPLLFQDMKVLEKSMRTIGTLVNTHILLQAYEKHGSELILSQIKSSQMMLKVEFRKLKHARRRQEDLLLQHRLSPTQSPELKSFAQAILQIVEKGISQLQNREPAPNSSSTIDSRSPSTSPGSEVPSPVTPPSTPPHQNDRDQAFEVEPEADESLMPRPKVHRRRTRSEPPQRGSPLSPSPSFLSTVVEDENHEHKPEEGKHEQSQNRGDKNTYMQVPPKGPLKYVPRPRAGQTSSDFASPSSRRLGRQEDNPRRQGQSYSTLGRRNDSDISVYGNGGEVTHSHLTGFIGLPPGSRKGKSKGSQ